MLKSFIHAFEMGKQLEASMKQKGKTKTMMKHPVRGLHP